MEVKLFDLTKQYQSLQETMETAVVNHMAAGSFIMGEAVSSFERSFAAYIGVKHAIGVNSGTDALLISLRAMGIGEGDEVITTPFTFFATAEPIALLKAVPVFADVDPNTFNLDPEKIEAKITDKTKAIIPVHIFGQPAQMDDILAIAKKHNLMVIEDACQAAGASYHQRKVGSIGNCGCFSFFPTKNLGAYGDGGMITTNDDRLATLCRAYQQHGMGQNGAKACSYLDGTEDELAGTAEPTGLYNPYKYFNYLIGYNSRLDSLQAKVLSVKLPHLDEYNSKRYEISKQYCSGLKNCESVIVPEASDDVKHVWHQFALRCEHKRELMQFLTEHSIGSAPFYPIPLHLQKAFQYLNYKRGDLPVAESLSETTVCLPIYPELTRDEIDYIIQCICKFKV